MALSDFRDTFSWQEAVELGPELVGLAEQLPASEEMGLAFRLRQVMIDLPGAIAEDLLESDSYTRRVQIARLAAILDIIDKVFPALDTASARVRLEDLTDRVASDRFGEQTPGAKQAYLPGAKVHAGPPDPAPQPFAPPRPALDVAPPPPPPPRPGSPASVPIVPEPDPAPLPDDAEPTADAIGPEDAAPPALKVPVTPDEPDNVQPDRVQ